MNRIFANRLRCESCGSELGELDPRAICPKCGGLLSVETELPSDRGTALRALFDGRLGAARAAGQISASGVWRFRELVLPGIADSDLVTQWEGNTPLLARERVAGWAEVAGLLLKHEGHNPTGSFKDRGMTVAVSNAVRIGASAVKLGLTYSRFMAGLKKAGVTLNRKILADMAVRDEKGFEALFNQAKAALG